MINFSSVPYGACAHGYNYIPIAFGVMLYIVYLIECWHYYSKHYRNIAKVLITHYYMVTNQLQIDVQSAYDAMNRMRRALPIVWWKSVCYHYARRTRQLTRYRNGHAITTTQIFYERVNSHTSASLYLYAVAGVKVS
jgi:hypothetical protein